MKTNFRWLQWLAACNLIALLTVGCQSLEAGKHPSALPLCYHNAKYGFTFYLPASWQRYSMVVQEWNGYPSEIEHGPIISLRNPQWKTDNQYQDIPIMVLTRKQWDEEGQGKFFPYTGGVIYEMWHNDRYVFGNYSRYNAYYLKGWQDADSIIRQNCDAHKMAQPYPH